jgi:hypothetical protein
LNLELNEDQASVAEAISQLLSRVAPRNQIGSTDYFKQSPHLEQALSESGFLDIGRQEGMGTLESGLLIEAVAGTPFVMEVSGTAMILPKLGLENLPRPIVLIDLPMNGPVRFLGPTGTALIDAGDKVLIQDLSKVKVEMVKTPFAYPYGRFVDFDPATAMELPGVSVRDLRQWWLVGLSFEIVGAMQSALDMTVDYVKTRKQFGRALGTFQTIQHRLSECAVLVHGARILARRAATTEALHDGFAAAANAQDAAIKLAYETHQFHGAIGLTLEYPLHFWTYRLRALQGELGGRTRSSEVLAAELWDGDAPAGTTITAW